MALASASSITIEVPCETVWEVISDLDSLPSILTAVVSVERTSGPDFGIGTRWREVRCYKAGEDISFSRVITDMSKSNDPPHRYKVQMGFTQTSTTYTNTLTLEPSDDDKSCQLICTFAFASESCISKVFYAWCGRFLFQKQIQIGMDTDLEEFAKASRKLQKDKEAISE